MRKIDFTKKYYLKRLVKDSPFKEQNFEGVIKFVKYAQHGMATIIEVEETGALFLILNPERFDTYKNGYMIKEYTFANYIFDIRDKIESAIKLRQKENES